MNIQCPRCQIASQPNTAFCANCGFGINPTAQQVSPQNKSSLKTVLIVFGVVAGLCVLCGVISGIKQVVSPAPTETRGAVTSSQTNNTSNQTKVPTPDPRAASQAQKSELKIKPEFFSLIGKSSGDIEKLYGKHNFVDKKFVQFKNGEFRLYSISDKNNLQIDYYKDKAVGFYYEIPEDYQLKSLEDSLKFCGLNVTPFEAKSEQKGYWWDDPPGAKPFHTVRISRFNDSGLYHNCEAHIQIN